MAAMKTTLMALLALGVCMVGCGESKEEKAAKAKAAAEAKAATAVVKFDYEATNKAESAKKIKSAVVINAPPPERSLEVQFLDGELNGADLEEVTKLDLDGYQLTELPKNLENLTQLKVLVLSKNQLTEIPKGLEELDQLTSLNLEDNPALTKAQIDHLQKALPKCKIDHNAKK